MAEKRKFQRFNCKLKCRVDYFDGDPEKIDIRTAKSIRINGKVLDISKGGIFLTTNKQVGINRPVVLELKTDKSTYKRIGNIVRTGFIENNPSEILHKFAKFKIKEKFYIAIEFDQPIDDLSPEELD